MATVRITLGIDEAGRGPAIGPMVVAAVALDTRAAQRLTRAGLRDSKASLVMLCQIGKPATSMKLECAQPEPLAFYPKAATWTCRYFGDMPKLTYEATARLDGPPVKNGETFKMHDPRLEPKGAKFSS